MWDMSGREKSSIVLERTTTDSWAIVGQKRLVRWVFRLPRVQACEYSQDRRAKNFMTNESETMMKAMEKAGVIQMQNDTMARRTLFS